MLLQSLNFDYKKSLAHTTRISLDFVIFHCLKFKLFLYFNFSLAVSLVSQSNFGGRQKIKVAVVRYVLGKAFPDGAKHCPSVADIVY